MNFSVLLLVRGHYHHDTQDVIMHESPLLVAIPLLGVFWLFCFCFVCWFVVFLFLLVCFCGLFCVFGFLAGTAYRSTTSTFVAIDKLTAVHDNYNSSFATIERV